VKKLIQKAIPKIVGFYLNSLSFAAPKLAADKALYLFATPRKGKILDNQQEFLNTSVQEKIFLNEIPIMTYSWEGEGNTVLLAHGWESNAFRWSKLIQKLRTDNYHVVALDAPAHGESGSSQFNALLYAEFINEAVQRFQPQVLIGHSVGGMASAFYHKKYQFKELDKLVLLGTPSEFVNVFKNYTDLLGYNSRLRNHLNQMIVERFGNTPESFSAALHLNDIPTKGLVIHDRNDMIIPYDEALLINASFKNAKLITTEGLGHSLHHDSVNKYILEFLNS